MGSTFVVTPVSIAPGSETLADMTLRVARQITRVHTSQATGGGTNHLIDLDLEEPNGTYDRGPLWILSGALAGKVVKRIKSQVANRFNFGTSIGSAVAAQQVETLTVLGSITGAGNATVVLTSAEFTTPPKTLSVAMTNAWTASQVATAVRAALAADTDIAEVFSVGGSGADVVLTALRAGANDSTLNLSIDNGTCTGLTPVPTSTNTTAGVTAHYAVADGSIPWGQLVGAINEALRGVMVSEEDSTIIGDGSATEYALPAGVYGVWRVEVGDDRAPSFHSYERDGKLVFDQGFAPSAETLHVWYAKPHGQLSAATDAIHPDVNLEWLEAKAAFALGMAARKTFGKDPRFDIETALQVAAQKLTSLKPNLQTRISYESAGTPE